MSENPENEGPTGPEALGRVGEGDASPATHARALAYFMGEEPPPGKEDRIPLDVDFGKPGAPNFQRCVFRTLANEELVKCEELAQVKDDRGLVERVDPFTRWSYVFAYACEDPNLAEALTARRERGEDHADVSSVVRAVFRFQPGVLKWAALTIEQKSRIDDDKERAVREVEAGKG